MTLAVPAATRVYGQQADDLDVPFSTHSADVATTALLAALFGQPREAIEAWTLAYRLQALLALHETALHEAHTPGAALPAIVRCQHCGERFELEIPSAQCRRTVDESPLVWTAPDGRALHLRLPNAADLALWRARGCTDPAAIAASLVSAVDGVAPDDPFLLPPSWVEPLSAALAGRDPLGALQADAPCPECDGVNTTELDLEPLLLAGFAEQQRRLLDEVAALAGAFHWTEAQILALPAWRRAFYLAHVDAERTVPA